MIKTPPKNKYSRTNNLIIFHIKKLLLIIILYPHNLSDVYIQLQPASKQQDK